MYDLVYIYETQFVQHYNGNIVLSLCHTITDYITVYI